MRLQVASLGILVLILSCASMTINTDKTIAMNENKITQQVGVIDFWKDLDKFTISYSVPNTIDQQFSCVVPRADMIPIALRKPGLKVVFSGVITKDPTLPPPRMGGEEIYLFVKLDSVVPHDNN